MSNWILTAILLVFSQILTLALVFLVARRYASKLFHEFFDAPDKNTPSAFAKLVENVADEFSGAIVTRAKCVLMGEASGQSRAIKGLEKALIEDGLSQGNPLIGALLDSYPTAKKYLLKYPQLLGMVQGAIGKASAPVPGNGHSPDAEIPGFGARGGKF